MTDTKAINFIKSLGIDMINKAGSGHPGIVLGAAPMIYTLFKNHLHFNVTDPKWIGRDRFVLSAGHGSALLYATMHLFGYPVSRADMEDFRKVHSKTPGHPEYGYTEGVEATTGPLGQGFANAVGMAIAARHLKATYKTHEELFNYHVYVLCSDGDLMEGVAHEAASLAGNLQLDNLIVLYDSNKISLDGHTDLSFTEQVLGRFSSLGWNTDVVESGEQAENISYIDKAIHRAKQSNKPTIIEVKTIIGSGSELANTHEVHGKMLTQEDSARLRLSLVGEEEPFFVPEEVLQACRYDMQQRSLPKYRTCQSLQEQFALDHPNHVKVLENLVTGKNPIDLLSMNFDDIYKEKEATRITNGKLMTKLSTLVPNLIGGSADLASSTKTYLEQDSDMTKNHYEGKNIWFGVREHAMGSAVNGLALSGMRAFGSTFLVFSDYMRASIRLAAIMNIPSTFIFSHDSINIGQDGPTHQPIEHLASLRAIPNLAVFRPADAHELVGVWHEIVNDHKPNCLIVSRADTPLLSGTKADHVKYGGYIVRQEKQQLDAIVIATGSELSVAVSLAESLWEEHKFDIRVVSMPCQELFLMQRQEYQQQVLPDKTKNIVIEAGSAFGWDRFITSQERAITINDFGASGKTNDVLEYCNFTDKQIKERILKMVNR